MMKTTSTAIMTKWAVIAVACTLVLSACGAKPAEKDTASAGTQTSTQNGSQPAAKAPTTPADSTQQPASQPATKKSWTAPPAMAIDVNKTYQATIKTSKGSFQIDLYAKDAPITVNNFVFLAKEGFYNDIVFHRIMESFMIQTGDPLGIGSGGPGYRFQDELKSPYKYEPGIVAMANAGSNTNGSQFFICTGESSLNLNKSPNYTIFGKVTEGMDIVKKIAATPVTSGPSGEKSSPTEKVVIQSVSISEK